MPTIQEQFKFEEIVGHFEKDSHIGVQGLEIEKIHVLYGETSEEDILVLLYKGSPNLSFYDTYGQLIDVDHYLPDNYQLQDSEGAKSIISNLKGKDDKYIKEKLSYKLLLEETFNVGNGNLATGLKTKYGLETSSASMDKFKIAIGFAGERTAFEAFLLNKYSTFYDFLEAYIVSQQKDRNGYVHITSNDNIIITPLNKRSGLAVIIETQDIDNKLLPPNKWVITRTPDSNKLKQALVFRTEDIKAFFDADGYEETFETERYKLYQSPQKIAIDSLLDNTDNLLKLNVVNDCYQILASDLNIIVVLTNDKEITVINTHRSIVPHKWPKKILLPESCHWMRVDENLSTLFMQTRSGEIIALDITGDHPIEISKMGAFALGFEVDQSGSLIFKAKESNHLIKIKTNVNDLELTADQKHFGSILKNLSHFFKGESLFTKTQFARIVTEEKAPPVKKLPSAIEIARYDFETNIEHMLVNESNDYEQLLDIKNKVAIARQNIAEELSSFAEQEGIFLVGQRLQSTINSIIRPTEKKVRNLVESKRAGDILDSTENFRAQIGTLTDPDAYREILNAVRKFEEELKVMNPDNARSVITDFKIIQQELNTTFSDQIANDGTTLQKFISGEIEQIEQAIKNTHDPRQLEILLSTHPASLELMALLKQPFVLQSIAKEQKLSPSGIQSRLYQSIEQRKGELKTEIERKEAERNAAKLQLANMIQESIDFFVKNHTGGFSDLELSKNASHQQILSDIVKLERLFNDIRLAQDLRRKLERRILERNRADLEKMVAFEGKYAFIQNDPDLFIDLDSTVQKFATWEMELIEKRGHSDAYMITFVRDLDKQVYRPSTTENLRAGKAFEITSDDYASFLDHYETYAQKEFSYELLDALWTIQEGKVKAESYPQFNKASLNALQASSPIAKKALRCALEKRRREQLERTRLRNVPKISPEFIDETPYFQEKLQEFVIKAKLQLVTGSGIILLSGPPSTGKSAFLKFISAVMNREYFEHAADKWQTKNSLVTAIKFGENGPYAMPAGFTKAITTAHSLINIEEIKEWPEALRKSLNPFFAGSDSFIAPDGTSYKIGDNILLCAAANLGSMYRQDDEPFTADFWSRIEVVEYSYAPEAVDRTYYDALHRPRKHSFLTMQDLARFYFYHENMPQDPTKRAMYFSQQFLEFILLPKADEKVKRENLQNHIRNYFQNYSSNSSINFGPEEAAKVALRRLKDFQGYSPAEFFDLYDHFINGQNLNSKRLAQLQLSDVKKYEHLRILILSLRYIEGCLRELRELFYTTAGQTEIEGTNREFIKCVYLLGLLGAS